MPGLCGCTVDHVKSLNATKGTLPEKIRVIPWLCSLRSNSFLLNASEREVWPAVEQASKQIASNQQAEQDAGLNTIVENFTNGR